MQLVPESDLRLALVGRLASQGFSSACGGSNIFNMDKKGDLALFDLRLG
jgi:hypothetical protein